MWLLIGLLVIGLPTATTSLFALLKSREQSDEQARFAILAETAAKLADQEIGVRMAILYSMQELAERGTIRDAEDFKSQATSYVSRFPGFIAINRIDATRTITTIVPYEGNAGALGRKVGTTPEVIALLDAAQALHTPQATRLVPLFQGATGVATYFPVVVDGLFDGYVNGVLNLGVIQRAIAQGLDPDLKVTLHESADPNLSADRRSTGQFERQQAIHVLNREWIVQVSLANSVRTRWSNPSTWEFAIGMLLSLALAVFMLLNLRERRRSALSETRLRDYAETNSDWCWETGPDHCFTLVSPRLSDLGVEPERRLGVRRWDFADDTEEQPDKWRDHIKTIEEHRPFRNFTYRTRRADGAAIYISTSGKPIFDPSGRFMGYRGVSSDVTAAVRTEQALREAREQELRHQTQKIAADAERLQLLQRLVDVQEHERLRIARELHDQMGQDLIGLSLGLKRLEAAVQDDSGRATLQWLQSLTVQIGQNVHRAAWELRPTSLDDVGLVRALQTYVADWGERFGIRVDFHAGDHESSQFPADVETTAYRVVQEALTNVLKHAAASLVSLVLECDGRSLQIIVEDDGKGFDPERSGGQSRLGLAGMRERLALVGGTLAIESTPAAGTTLYIRVPLREARERAGGRA
ncbi:MAG: ATP-binding protein [Stellaceae bacterium]